MNPAERQQWLASELARAYTVLALAGALGVLAIVVLTWMTFRRSVEPPNE